MSNRTVALLGSGFLASFIAPAIIPYFDKFVIIDKDRVEKENYDNSLYPRGMVGKKKVFALGSLLSILSGRSIILYNKYIKDVEDLEKLYSMTPWDIGIVTFDNVKARRIALDFSIKRDIPTLFAGVSLNYAYVDWERNIKLPQSDEEIEDEIRRIRDICTRLEFRPLGSLVASLVMVSIVEYITSGRRISHIASIERGIIKISSFEV